MAARSLGALTIDLIAKTAGFIAGLDKAAREARDRMDKMAKYANAAGRAIGTGIRYAAVGIAAATTALTALTIESIKYADELQDLSAKLGISTEQLSKWAYVANLSGTDIDTVARSVGLLSKNLAEAADPTSEMGKLFSSLGVAVKDAAGNLRSAEEVLPELADRFKTLDNQTLETALAMKVFGRSGADLLEFLNRGSDGINELGDELQSLGGVISGETARAAEQFNEELGRIQQVSRGLGLQIAQQLLPVLIDTAKEFRQLVKDGDLAANIVSVITTAMNAGVSAIRTYNAAVEITTATIEAFVQASLGAIQVTRNLATLGFADGSVVGGLRMQADALNDLVDAREKAIKQRDNPTIAPDFSNVVGTPVADPGVAAAAKERNELEARLNRLLTEREPAAKKAIKANDDLKKAEEERLRLLKEQQDAADDLVMRETEAYWERERNAKQLVSDLQFELELLKLGNAERDTAIQLRGMEAEQVAAYGEAIAAANEEIYRQMQQLELMDGARDAFATFFEDTISGTESVTDAFKNMLDDINAMILRRITENWVEQLFGAFGTTQTGSAGNWIATFASWFGGGKANGGWAAANTLYEVNERGLEMATVGGRDFMLTGNQPVQVTPNHKLGGGVSQVNQFTIQGRIDRRTEDHIAQKVGWKTQTAMARNG
jgi:hypothetical protein